jgi:hypothetical protein
MIKASRKALVPESLTSAAATAEAKAAADFYKGWSPGAPAFKEFKQYRGYDVVQSLRTSFHGKCAYCEGPIEKGASEVEHYRPKGGVHGADHPGYWWLAHTWTNLLPTCPPCNKALKQHVVTPTMTIEQVEQMQASPPSALLGKANQFPVGGTRLLASSHDHDSEIPLLLDPTRGDPKTALEWRHASDYSVVVPVTAGGVPCIIGKETINCVGLNRLGLVEARTKQLNVLKVQRIKILHDLEQATQDPANFDIHVHYALQRVEDMLEACKAEQPYSAMTKSFVDAFRAELRDWIRQHTPALVPFG